MISQIETAMIQRVANANGADAALGYQIATIASYAGELTSAEDLAAAMKRFPAVLFAFAGEPKPKVGPGGDFVHEPVFAAFCCAQNLRNEQASRHGAGGLVGSYQLIMDVRELLTGQTLGLEIAEIEPGRVRSVLQGASEGAHASIYAVEFHTAYITGRPAPEGLDEFETFHADWDVPPHGNVGTDLPNETADAQDTVLVEGAIPGREDEEE